jgi:two-component sensor histidine kinase
MLAVSPDMHREARSVTSNQATLGDSANEPTRSELEYRLREVRHRFRNSLQFLNSLVGLHARGIVDPQARAAFADLRVRLVALSWIYDTIDEEYGRTVDLGHFLPRVGQQMASLNDREGRFRLSFDVAEATIDARSAALVAQILGELLGGLYRGAFTSATSGSASIALRKGGADGLLELEVVIDNQGSAPTASTEQLGTAIVRSLGMSLNGTFALTHDGCDRATLRFGPRPASGH